jgi:HK97 family phage major capsid protein
MNKLEKKKMEIHLEIRSLQQGITTGSVTADAAKKKFDELRSKLAAVEKEIAETRAPKNRDGGSGAQVADLVAAMREKRAITLNGTGAIAQVEELFKELQKKTPILEKVRKFAGHSANTNIPVLSPGLAHPGSYAEGATNVVPDSTANLTTKILTPYSWVSVLPVWAEVLSLGSIDFESKLSELFADAFAQTFHQQILTGDGTGRNFQGLFAGIPAVNHLPCKEAGAPTIEDLELLALSLGDFVDDSVIIMHPSIYAAILDSASDAVDAILVEGLVRDRTIEGVKVILTGGAPDATTKDSIVAMGGRLSDYGFAMASELTVSPIQKVGDTNTYFQAVLFANGAKIVDKNFYGLKAIEAV